MKDMYKVGDYIMVAFRIAEVDDDTFSQPYYCVAVDVTGKDIEESEQWIFEEAAQALPSSKLMAMKEAKKLETLAKITALQKELESL